jgi:nicotinamidase-related amidase
MGRILVRGERGHDIVPELYPDPGEVVIDKPGKGAFCATDLDHVLHHRGIKSLIVCGVTTEVCVNTTVREANDRGYECVVLADCVGSYFSGVPARRAGDDQGAGRDIRLGVGFEARVAGDGGMSAATLPGSMRCRRDSADGS